MLAYSSSIYSICLVVHCAAPCAARVTRWGVALRCGSTERQACPPLMLRIAVSGLPSRKIEFLEVPMVVQFCDSALLSKRAVMSTMGMTRS
jgi:hypothetical protein